MTSRFQHSFALRKRGGSADGILGKGRKGRTRGGRVEGVQLRFRKIQLAFCLSLSGSGSSKG